ncbi:MAG TPA: LysR family transcriptional regulator [Anaerolineales bacterium]|nr:LysR family transcriptional regulator [Anaerolineales bacterium]
MLEHHNYHWTLSHKGKPMVELSTLRVFLVAAEEKNFSMAAKRLHMSQSAVSQNIQTLERIYGVELFIRRGRSIKLSDIGEVILPAVRDVLNSARLLDDSLRHTREQIGGELIIGCSTSAGKYIMPTLLAAFCRSYPAIRPRINIMSRDAVYDRLRNEILPIGITSKYLDRRDLECLPLFEDRIILIVPPDHSWTKFGRAMPADLLDQPLITREEASGTCETVMEGLKSFDIVFEMLNVMMEIGNPEAITMAVEQGMGIAFVSEMVAVRSLALGRIKKVEVEGLDLRRTIYISRNITHPFTRAQSLFWNYAQAQRERLNSDIWQNLVRLMPVM